MAELPKLRVGLALDSASFITETRRVNDSVNRLGADVAKQGRAMQTAFNTAAVAARSLVGVFSVQQIASFARSTFAWADSLQELAGRVGIGVEQLQKLQQAAARTDVSTSELEASLERFGRNLGDAARKGGDFADVLAQQGIALRTQSGALRSIEDVFGDYVQAVADASTEQEKLALAMAAFGKGGANMVTTLETLAQRQNDFNVLTAGQVANLAEYDDTISDFTEQLGYYAKVGLGEYIAFLEKYYGALKAIINTILKAFDELAGTSFAADEPLTVDIKTAMPWVKGWNEQLAEWEERATDATGATGGLASAVNELTAAQKRLAEAGKILLQTSAAEERAFKETERRMLEMERMAQTSAQKEKGMLPPIVAEEDVQRVLVDPFSNALESIQAEFTSVFEQMQRGAITTFKDVADSMEDIFVNLNSNLLSLAIFSPKTFKSLAKEVGLTASQLGAASATTALTPMVLGMFGAGKASQGATTGGAIGAGVGALAGSFIPGVGTALGAIAGGLGGTFIGALTGGLFGGGSQSNKITSQGGLGVMAGGTGAGAQFVTRIDQQLAGLLDARSEALVNAALRAAPGVSVQYSKEPSANDLSNLARGRIGPAAMALGFDPRRIAGAPRQFSAEQQLGNLQTAVALQRQLEGFRIGPIETQFRDLKDRFVEMGAEARRLGLDTSGLAEAHARERHALTRRIQIEKISLAERIGAMRPLDAALRALDVAMREAAAQAKELGVSTANIAVEHQRQARELAQQDRIQRLALMETIGLVSPLQRALGELDAAMRMATIQAERLGISTAEVAAEYQRLREEIIQQDRIQRHALMATVGLITPLQQALGDLDASMKLATAEAERLGISTAGVAAEYQRLREEIIQQDRIQRHALMVTVGLMTPLQQALGDLDANMKLATAEAERLGISTAGVAAEHQRLREELIRENQAATDAQALSIIEPFERLREPLQEFGKDLEYQLLNPLQQMRAAEESFRAIAKRALGGDIEAIEQFQAAGERYIEEAGRFGASPAQVAAIKEVMATNQQLSERISQAQREASTGVERAIQAASQREVDTLRELTEQMRLVGEDLKRLVRK